MTVSYPHLCVMVVEDSTVQRLHALDLLASLGITRRLEAADGQQALDVLAVSPERPDILITDLEMPGMDGVDLIRHIAEQKLATALIVVSSRETTLLATVETMALEHGLEVIGVAQKPLSFEHLAELIERYRGSPVAAGRSGSVLPHFSLDEIRTGLETHQLVLHYQPKVTTFSGVMRGAEALVRWNHPQYGLVAPLDFVPVAEQGGLIDDLTDWVLESALRQVHAWHARGLTIVVAVNLSAKSLAVPDLADRIATMASRIGVEPKYLMLEITETAVMSDLALSLGTLARLRLKGFGLSIDDFGTGFSSMQQLSRIPFTELKIDRSLVHGAAEKPHLHVMLQSTIEMSKKLHLTTVAEGVENPADWQLIRLLGCDVGQGFYVARPMPGEELAGWLKQGLTHLRMLRPPSPS
ncbi:EAL domain-containing response regulator [Chitinimonas lacunae]|uniref:EAL domain-containing protein n=1 Tax=Chitinimonas lacunae TaxID=1963018 RepID=A0ABV8MPE9_9NEIS